MTTSTTPATSTTAPQLRVTVEHHPGRLTAPWTALATSSRAVPFVHPGWLRAWRAAFGRGRLVLFAAWRGPQLVGLLPLEHRNAVMLRSPTNWHTPELAILAEDDGVRAALLRAAAEHRGSSITLDLVNVGSAEHAAMLELSPTHRIVERPVQRSPFVVIDRSWEEYERRFTSKHRASLRRRWRRLVDIGEVTIDEHDGHGSLDPLLRDCLDVEAAGIRAAGTGTAIRDEPHVQRFYEDVARWAASQGWLRIELLRIDGRAIAFSLSLHAYGVVYGLKTGYDPEFRSLGPGILLIHHLLHRAFTDGFDRFEMLGTDDPFKMRFTDDVHTRLRLQAFAPGPAGGAQRLAVVHGRPVAKRGLQVVRSMTARVGAKGVM